MDLSNILKKYQETKKGRQQKARQPEPEDFYASAQANKKSVALSQIVAKDVKPPSEPHCRQVYDACLSAVSTIYASVRDASVLKDDQVTQAAQKALELFQQDESCLVTFIVADYPQEKSFLHRHAVNTGLISCLLAGEIGMNQTECLEACLVGFLHDIGLEYFPEILGSPDPLTEEERRQIREHPAKGYDALNRMDTRLSKQVLEAVYQEHERMDGSGYPRGLVHDGLNQYARIVGLASVYEKLTHWRPYRKRVNVSEAIQSILGEKAQYDPRVLKALIERIGIFPPGVLVQLNTREVAVVTRINKKAPFRPVVTILYDALGKKMAEPKLIDLAAHTVVYVQEALQEILEDRQKAA